jgi:hypothetical protein
MSNLGGTYSARRGNRALPVHPCARPQIDAVSYRLELTTLQEIVYGMSIHGRILTHEPRLAYRHSLGEQV